MLSQYPNIIYLFLICLLINLFSCGGGTPQRGGNTEMRGSEQTTSGVKYKFFIKNDTKKAQNGDLITFHIVVEVNDSILSSTYGEYEQAIQELPFERSYFIGKPYFKDIFEQVSEGDSISFWINADSLSKYAPNPPYIKKGSYVKHTVKILKIESKTDIQKRIEESLKVQVEIDEKSILSYLKDNKDLPKIEKTKSGLRYCFHQKSKVDRVSEGDTVLVNYTSKLLDNTVFDSTEDNGAVEIVIGHSMIKGLDEGLSLMGEGEKATFIIPSKLGFGSQDKGSVVPPNSVLVFDIELVRKK